MWWKIVLIVLGSIVFLIIVSVMVDNILFKQKIKYEVADIFARTGEVKTRIITEDDIKVLPEPVQRYFRYTGVIGKENIIAVRLKQRGFFRQGDRPWMPFEAEQYYTTDPPAFLWSVRMKALPLFYIKGRDMYHEGRGNMLIKLPFFIKIADARGEEIDQGTLLRYLNEIMWFPTAYLNSYIQWEPIDSTSARATMNYMGVTASAILYFNEKGELTDFVAQRYMSIDKGYSLETWSTPVKEYRDIKGIRLPVKGEGVWKLNSGDFTYIKLEIIDIEYNNIRR